MNCTPPIHDPLRCRCFDPREVCARCGKAALGDARGPKGERLCHPDEGPSCYLQETVAKRDIAKEITEGLAALKAEREGGPALKHRHLTSAPFRDYEHSHDGPWPHHHDEPEPRCVCGESDTAHRTDGPCYLIASGDLMPRAGDWPAAPVSNISEPRVVCAHHGHGHGKCECDYRATSEPRMSEESKQGIVVKKAMGAYPEPRMSLDLEALQRAYSRHQPEHTGCEKDVLTLVERVKTLEAERDKYHEEIHGLRKHEDEVCLPIFERMEKLEEAVRFALNHLTTNNVLCPCRDNGCVKVIDSFEALMKKETS